MPIQSTDIDASGGFDGFDISSDYVTYLIKSGVTVLTTTGIAVSENYYSDLIDNFGHLVASYSDGVAIYGSSKNSTLINEAGGTISGSSGVIVNGLNAYIANYGTITGSHTGIEEFAGSGTHVDNYGIISGNSIGIEDDGVNDIAFNHGTISSIGTGFLFSLGSGTGTLDNLGTISGITAAISASGAGAVAITNHGSLVGDVTLTNTGGASIINKGAIQGSVTFGDGNNIFRGHGGTVDGPVIGGAGSDTLNAGADGETLDGGAGRNVLTGGAGADTFQFSAIGASTSDRINGFNFAAGDGLALDHTVFTTLVVDVTPVFAIGTTASSANDHLFYNTSSGNLYYDSNGNGAGHTVFLAHLAPGLHLTAGDFSVF